MTRLGTGVNYWRGISIPVVRDNATRSIERVPAAGDGLEITSSALSLLRWKPYDEEFFTTEEMREIERSLDDLKKGNYKSFKNTDELFADLDSE